MNKPLLIVILVAVLAAFASAVWYQQTHFGQQLDDIQKKLKEDEERSRLNHPFVPGKTSGRADGTKPGLLCPAFT